MKLTGNYYFKQTIFGLILMIECLKPRKMPDGETVYLPDETVYIKARPRDLRQINFDKK